MRLRVLWVGLLTVAVLASGYVVVQHALPAKVDGAAKAPLSPVDRILARGRPGPDSELCEVDQDKAAEQYALARALKTDWEIAQRDVAPLGLLHEVRDALNDWEAAIFSTGSVINHGGTFWSHTGNRAPADIEDFLVALAPRMPAESDINRFLNSKELPETAAVLKRIDALPAIAPDGVSSPAELIERNRDLADEKRKLREAWVELDHVLLYLPPDLSSVIAQRATRHLVLLEKGEDAEDEKGQGKGK